MVADNESEVTAEEFNKIINDSHKIVVVDFYAEWCMPCLMMTPIIEDLAQEMKEIKFMKINTEDHCDLSSKYGISSIPCLVVFKNGKEAGRIIGAHSYEMIANKIKKCVDECQSR